MTKREHMVLALRHAVGLAAVLAIGAFTNSPALAQALVPASSSGTTFSPEGRGGHVKDVNGGRVFRADAFDKLTVRGKVPTPPSNSGLLKLKRLVIHFRTSREGPSLRAVTVGDGASKLRITTDLEGDYTAKDATKPERTANAWVFDPPLTVNARTLVHLEVQYPGGFDSRVNPGEFLLTAVGAVFERKP